MDRLYDGKNQEKRLCARGFIYFEINNGRDVICLFISEYLLPVLLKTIV